MAQTTIEQFATEMKMPSGALLEQLTASGVAGKKQGDKLSEQDKTRLLDYLRKQTAPEADAKQKVLAGRGEGQKALQIGLAEASCPVPSAPLQIDVPFRYIVGYPRSGNTLLMQYLSYTFAAPAYTVYPAASRYFSRRFPPRAPGHPVFVKDHVLRAEYAEADEARRNQLLVERVENILAATTSQFVAAHRTARDGNDQSH